MAERMADDYDSQKAETFAKKHAGKGWIENFKTLLYMLKDPNFNLSSGTWAAIAGAIAYVVCPVDLIPDFIPGLGFIDDVFVLTIVTNQVSHEIVRYRTFIQDSLHS